MEETAAALLNWATEKGGQQLQLQGLRRQISIRAHHCTPAANVHEACISCGDFVEKRRENNCQSRAGKLCVLHRPVNTSVAPTQFTGLALCTGVATTRARQWTPVHPVACCTDGVHVRRASRVDRVPRTRYFHFQVERLPERQDHDRAAQPGGPGQNRAIPLQRQNDAWFMRQRVGHSSDHHPQVSPTCRARARDTAIAAGMFREHAVIGLVNNPAMATASAHSSNPASRDRLIGHRFHSQARGMPVNPAVSLWLLETSTTGRR